MKKTSVEMSDFFCRPAQTHQPSTHGELHLQDLRHGLTFAGSVLDELVDVDMSDAHLLNFWRKSSKLLCRSFLLYMCWI